MPDPTPGAGTASKQSVGLKYKIICYAVAWLAALFATNPNGGLWALAWMFPLGLAAFIDRQWANSGGWGVFAGCIAVYLIHAWFYFRSRTLRTTLFLFGVLAILLICNVSGCRAMIHAH
jgi:hypothetical protein